MGLIDHGCTICGGKVTNPAQEPSGHARGASCASRNLACTLRRQGRAHLARRLDQHVLQFAGGIEFQAQGDAEPVAQGRGQHARTGGGCHQGERRQVNTDRAGARSLTDH